MPVRIKLVQGEELVLDVDVKAWNTALERALAEDKMLQIEDPHGRVLTVNPSQIVYSEEVPAEESAPAAPAVATG